MTSVYTSQNTLLLNNLITFYKESDNMDRMLSIINGISWIILLIFSVVVTPIARAFINDAISQTNNSLEVLALNGILPIYWLLLIGVLVLYAIPRSSGGTQY
jgi:hypothetical protein